MSQNPYIKPTNTACGTAYMAAMRARKQAALINQPTGRRELQNPYGSANNRFTVEDFNMRRKAEILKHHSKPRGDTQRASFVEKVNNPMTLSSAQRVLNQLNDTCSTKFDVNPTKKTVPMPGYFSDVPGSNVFLYLDPDVPLYVFNQSTIDSNSPNGGAGSAANSS
jgi:hypothetical protein